MSESEAGVKAGVPPEKVWQRNRDFVVDLAPNFFGGALTPAQRTIIEKEVAIATS